MREITVRGVKPAELGFGHGYGWGFLARRGPAWWPGFRSSRGFRGLVGCPATHLIG